ncbi:MAG: hypothetical protein ABSG67_22605 [Thermoguttaceae bacterium]|jgi:hypothetical protein
MTITDSDKYFCGTVEVCRQSVSFWYDIEEIELTEECKEKMTEEAEERAKELITEEYWCGELNCGWDDQEIRGWWQIGHDKEDIETDPTNGTLEISSKLHELHAKLVKTLSQAGYSVAAGNLSPQFVGLYFHSPEHVQPFVQMVSEYYFHIVSVDMLLETRWKYKCVVFNKRGGGSGIRVRTLVLIPWEDLHQVLEAVEATDETCPDCGVQVGQPHDKDCDIARCPRSGRQRISCDCRTKKESIWTGSW